MADELTADGPEIDPLSDISDDYIASRVTVTLKCGYCGEAVGSSSGVGKKVYTHGCKCETTTKILIEKEVRKTPHRCPRSGCGHPFRTESDLRQHMQEAHDVLSTDQAEEILDTVEETHPELTQAANEGDDTVGDKLVAVAYDQLDGSSVESVEVLTEVVEERYY